jgi:hypothetical protein
VVIESYVVYSLKCYVEHSDSVICHLILHKEVTAAKPLSFIDSAEFCTHYEVDGVQVVYWQHVCRYMYSMLVHAVTRLFPLTSHLYEYVLFWNCWGSRLRPSSIILNTRKHNFSKLDLFPSSGEGGEGDTHICTVGSLRKASITDLVQCLKLAVSKGPRILDVSLHSPEDGK